MAGSSTIWAPKGEPGDKGPTGDQGPIGPVGPTGGPGPDAAAFVAFQNNLASDAGAFNIGNPATLAALRALPIPSTSAIVYVTEHSTGRGTAGGGRFRWLANSVRADDNGTVVKPTSITGNNPGRWERVKSAAEVDARWFGGWADGNTSHEADDTAAILAAIATGKKVKISAGTWIYSPLTTPETFPAPYVNEGNRTSGALLKDRQVIYGDGPSTILRWGPSMSPLASSPQCFFKIANATKVTIKKLAAENPFALLIIDPVANDSVKDVTVKDVWCKNTLIDVIAGRQLAIDPNAKYSSNVKIMNLTSEAPLGSHSILFTATRNAKALNCTFNDITQGYCVDVSQGTIGAVISGCTATNAQFFAKVESSDPVSSSGANQGLYQSSRVSISNNVGNIFSQSALLLNSCAQAIVITGNSFEGFTFNGINIGQASANTSLGALSVTGNTFIGTGTANAGINDMMTNGTEPHTFSANKIYGVDNGYWIARRNVDISGGSVRANNNGIVVNTAGVTINGITIGGGIQLFAPITINITGTGSARNVKILGALMFPTNSAIYGADLSSATLFTIQGCSVDSPTNLSLPAIALNNLRLSNISSNVINLTSGSSSAIQTFGTTVASQVVNNICTRPIVIASPDGLTVSTPNITTAAYAA